MNKRLLGFYEETYYAIPTAMLQVYKITKNA